MIAALSLALNACTAAREPVDPPAGPLDECGWGKLGKFLGQAADDATLAMVRQTSGHNRIRVIHPGTAVTMDYRADRLNVDVGADGRIRRFYCS